MIKRRRYLLVPSLHVVKAVANGFVEKSKEAKSGGIDLNFFDPEPTTREFDTSIWRERTGTGSMEELIQHLEQSQLDYADLVNELQVLISIYGDTALSLHPSTSSPSPSSSSQRIISSTTPLRLVLATTLTDSDLRIHIILSIPHDYPAISPPLLQLQDIYLHSYPVDDTLFAEICRVYMHQAGSGKGIDFQPGEVCLFDGIEWIRTRCTEYAQDRRRKEEEGQAAMKARQREEDRGERIESVQAVTTQPASNRVEEKPFQRRACPVIISAEPIVDRKSSFIGHCAKVTSLDEVRLGRCLLSA